MRQAHRQQSTLTQGVTGPWSVARGWRTPSPCSGASHRRHRYFGVVWTHFVRQCHDLAHSTGRVRTWSGEREGKSDRENVNRTVADCMLHAAHTEMLHSNIIRLFIANSKRQKYNTKSFVFVFFNKQKCKQNMSMFLSIKPNPSRFHL
jgi:hypothetical protein